MRRKRILFEGLSKEYEMIFVMKRVYIQNLLRIPSLQPVVIIHFLRLLSNNNENCFKFI